MRNPQQHIQLLADFEKALSKNTRNALITTTSEINESLFKTTTRKHDFDKIDALDRVVKLYVEGLQEMNATHNLSQSATMFGYVRSYGKLIDSGIYRRHPEFVFSAKQIGSERAILELLTDFPYHTNVHLYEWAINNDYYPLPTGFQVGFHPVTGVNQNPAQQRKNIVAQIMF